jgi:predicted nucleic acid-binding protein
VDALQFTEQLRAQANYVDVVPGARHWDIFASLCRDAGARGNLVPDAYFAALTIEIGGEWITTDRDYARFPGLSWRHPFTAAAPP